MSENNQEIIDNTVQNQNKVISLFQFIRELNKLKQKAIVNYSDYQWAKSLSSLPNDPDNISVFYRDRVENEEYNEDSNILLSVRKPEFEKCPSPNSSFIDWLEPGWGYFKNEVSYLETRPKNQGDSIQNDDNISIFDDIENFTDDTLRVQCFREWLVLRREWVKRQEIVLQTRNLFSDLYRLYFELQRDPETKELIVANGILCDKMNPEIKHPVLTKRVKLNYDPVNNAVIIEEIDSQPELYSIVFQTMKDINLQAINQLQENLQKNDYHPLDRNDTPGFLKVLVHQLSSDSKF